MAFCTKCGTRLEDGQKFCCICGNPVAATNKTPVHDAPAPQAEPETVPENVEAVETVPETATYTQPETVEVTYAQPEVVYTEPETATYTQPETVEVTYARPEVVYAQPEVAQPNVQTSEYMTPQEAASIRKKSGWMSIVCFVLGIVGLMASMVGSVFLVYNIALILCTVGIILGIIAFKRSSLIGFSITGVITGSMGMPVCASIILMTVFK